MKIGILTLPLHTNYGGILQAYALQTVLERMGHSVVLLKKTRFSLKAKVKKIAKKCLGCLENNEVSLAIDEFKKTYFKNWMNLGCWSQKELNSLDVIIVGSDQVWRNWGKNWNILLYFLDFAQNMSIKKYAYSVSFGKDEWALSSSQTERCKKLILQFSKVSVREKHGLELCKRYLNVNAEWLLDQTLLLVKEDYKSILHFHKKTEKKLVSYILDHNEKKDAILITFVKLYDDCYVDINKKIIYKGKEGVLPAVECWLNEMMNAKFLITDSFHGTAFAINFEIPFVVLTNEDRGQSRLQSILDMFGLQERLALDMEDAVKIAEQPIQWDSVRKIKQCYREKSISFLRGIET